MARPSVWACSVQSSMCSCVQPLPRSSSRNSAERVSSKGVTATVASRGPANTSATPISSASSAKAQPAPRTIPRPRAVASPISSPGRARNRRKKSAWPGESALSSAVATSVAETALQGPLRILCTIRGSGESVATSASSGAASASAASAAEAQAAPRKLPGRGSARSRTGREAGSRPSPSLRAVALIPAPAPPRPNPLLGRERQQRDVPRALDGQGQLALVLRAGAEHAARQYLAALGHEGGDQLDVLVVDVIDLVRAELADLAPPEEVALALLLAARAAPAAR